MSDKSAKHTLADRMDALAATHPRGEELRHLAKQLRAATDGYFGKSQTVSVRQFLGAWARARRVWCEITGEELV